MWSLVVDFAIVPAMDQKKEFTTALCDAIWEGFCDGSDFSFYDGPRNGSSNRWNLRDLLRWFLGQLQ